MDDTVSSLLAPVLPGVIQTPLADNGSEGVAVLAEQPVDSAHGYRVRRGN